MIGPRYLAGAGSDDRLDGLPMIPGARDRRDRRCDIGGVP